MRQLAPCCPPLKWVCFFLDRLVDGLSYTTVLEYGKAEGAGSAAWCGWPKAIHFSISMACCCWCTDGTIIGGWHEFHRLLHFSVKLSWRKLPPVWGVRFAKSQTPAPPYTMMIQPWRRRKKTLIKIWVFKPPNLVAAACPIITTRFFIRRRAW